MHLPSLQHKGKRLKTQGKSARSGSHFQKNSLSANALRRVWSTGEGRLITRPCLSHRSWPNHLEWSGAVRRLPPRQGQRSCCGPAWLSGRHGRSEERRVGKWCNTKGATETYKQHE